MRPSVSAWAVVAVVGSVVCTVCDHLHVITGVLWYPRPVFWQQAWWVPLLFAAASVVVVAGARLVRSGLGGRAEAVTARRVAGDGIAFVAAYAFTAYGHSLPDVVLAVLVAAWLARVVGGTPTWMVIFSLLVAAGGMLFEAFWSKLGFFYYSSPDFIGVPRWLPGLYLHVSFLAAGMGRLLIERGERGASVPE